MTKQTDKNMAKKLNAKAEANLGLTESRARPRRKVVYEAQSLTSIPQDVVDAFEKRDWKLRFIRYLINGEQDIRNLSKRKNEGWEFVTAKELTDLDLEWYLTTFQAEDTRNFKGLLISGDSVLAKADVELIQSRTDHFDKITKAELEAADVYTQTRKHGFQDLGSKSSITSREPQFRN